MRLTLFILSLLVLGSADLLANCATQPYYYPAFPPSFSTYSIPIEVTSVPCNWSVAQVAPAVGWITFPATSGTITTLGSHNIGTYNVAANVGSTPRHGGIRVTFNGVTSSSFPVDQNSPNCNWAVSPSASPLPVSGGQFTLSLVPSPSDCSTWTGVDMPSWVTYVSGPNPAINSGGIVTYNAAANPGGARSGSIRDTGTGFNYLVTQLGVASSISSITPTSIPAGSAGFTLTVDGSGFSDASVVRWNGSSLQTTSVSSTRLTALVPTSLIASPGTATITVYTLGSESNSRTLTIVSCTPALSPLSASFTASGGSRTISVTTPCSWTATTTTFWITITGGATGNGNGTVTYTVAANLQSQNRSGAIIINSQVFDVTQSGQCSLTLSSATPGFNAPGGNGTLSVAAPTGCSWSATSNASWITLGQATSGTGNGNVAFTVASYSGSQSRSGTIGVNGQLFTITQNGGNCTFTLSSTTQNFMSSGGTGSITVTTAAGCGWTASTTDSFLTITSGANGSVNGRVTYLVAPNPGGQRNGTLRIAGQTVTVTQNGGCGSPTLSTAQASFSSAGSSSASVTLNTGGACSWTATANQSFLHLAGASSGSGPAAIAYSVDANNTGSSRSGSLTINGLTLAVHQAAAPVCGPQNLSLSATGIALPAAGGGAFVGVDAPANCGWQVTNNASSFAAVSPSTGTASGTVQINAAANGTGNVRTGSIAIGGLTVNVTQPSLQSFGCTFQSIQPAQVRRESMTELLPELSLSCSGSAARDIYGDVLVQISNTNFTSRKLDDLTAVDAVLLINDANPVLGQQVANNLIRFANVLVAPAGLVASRGFKLRNLRIDGNASEGTSFQANIEIVTQGAPVAVAISRQTVATNARSIRTTIGGAVAAGQRTNLALTFTELLAGALRTKAQEAGYQNVSLGALVGAADSATRLFVQIPNVPSGVTVLAPVYSNEQNAQLVAQDPNGAGVGLLTGNPGSVQPLSVGNGSAVATWEVLTGSSTTLEAANLTLAFEGTTVAVVNQLAAGMIVQLAPVNSAATSNAVPRFAAINAPARVISKLRVKGAIQTSGGGRRPVTARAPINLPPGTPPDCASCRLVDLDVTLTNEDAAKTTTSTIIGTLPQGSYYANICEAGDGGGTCNGGLPEEGQSLPACPNCRSVVFSYPRLDQGGTVTTRFTVWLDDNAPIGSDMQLDVSANNDITTVRDSVRACLSGFGTAPPLVANGQPATILIYNCGDWTLTSDSPWLTFDLASGTRTTLNGTGNMVVTFTVQTNPGTPRTATLTLGGRTINITQPGLTPGSAGYRFVPLTPCRVMETRAAYNFEGRTGAFGPPSLNGGEVRTLNLPVSNVCSIPAAAKAYVVNVTVIPSSTVDYVTLWPAGDPRPNVWTIRSPDGQIVANSAIVKAGTLGGISVYASDRTDLLIDISGYYTDSTAVTGYAYYPLTPCRVIDTRLLYRSPPGPFGPPSMAARQARRFRFPATPYCQVPGAAAYSVTVTVAPPAALAYLTAWPSGLSQPNVSSINSFAGRVLANTVIIPASADRSIDVFTYDATDFLVDINGYYAPDDGSTGQFYFPVKQCRAADSRVSGGAYPDDSVRTIGIPRVAGCQGIPESARGYAINVTALPNGNPMPFLTAYPTGQPRPNASILNAFQGQVVTNGAIVPAGVNGGIEIYAYRRTDVVVEVSGYFGR